MDAVSLKEARKRLGALVNAAANGESVVITRRGRQVARLVPPSRRPVKGLPDLTEFRASIKINGPSLTDELLTRRRHGRY